MNGLAPIIAHNTLAALVLAAVAWTVTRVVRRPAVAHVLWLLVLLRLIAPPVVGFEYAFWPADRVEPASPVNDLQVPIGSSDSLARGLSDWLKPGRSTAQLADAPARTRETAVNLPAITAHALIHWLPRAALGVSALLALIAGTRIIRFRRRITQLAPGSAEFRALVAQAAAQLGLARIPDVRIGDLAGAPFVWNLGRRPTIVLPASFAASLDPQQLAMILTHELAHLRRRDHWVRLVELLVVITHWWNPLAHWARRRLHAAEEQACDAWVAWAFPHHTKQYAELLLQASQLAAPSPPRSAWLISPLFRHPLNARIAMLVHGSTPHQNSRLATLLLAAAALIALPSYVTLTAADGETTAASTATQSSPDAKPSPPAPPLPESNPDHPGRLNIRVVVSETNEPVEGATANAILGYYEPNGSIAHVGGKTGPDGTCSIPIPYGHLQTIAPFLPAGYWSSGEAGNPHQHDLITTSPAASTCSMTYRVNRGPLWTIRALDEKTGAAIGKLQCNIARQNHQRFERAGPTVLGDDGIGQFTPPGTGGEFRLHLSGPFAMDTPIRDWMQYRHIEEPGLKIDEGFDPQLIAEVSTTDEPQTYRLVDRQGRTATLSGATPSIVEGKLLIDVAVREWIPATEAGRGVGTVVDPEGNPLANARVVLQVHNGSVSWSGWQARTDANGRFEIDSLSIASADGIASARLVATGFADGYAPANSEPTAYPEAAGHTIDFGKITLAPGHSVRVVDVFSGPAVGAIVTPTTDLQPSKRNVTDERGEVVLHDLPAGKVQLAAMYGREYANTEVVVPEEGRETVLTTLRLRPQSVDEEGGPIANGEPAPALQVSDWTDGKDRALQDFKGRVVVLYFWDSAQEGCDQELAIIDSLRQRFAEDGVVFLGIHAARADLYDVEAWMKAKDWRLPTGLDRFNASKQSLTATAYGVNNPSFVVIGRDGRIAFNRDYIVDDDGGEQMFRQAAQALNIDLDAEEEKAEQNPDQQGCDACARILEFIQSRAIQNAVGPASE